MPPIRESVPPLWVEIGVSGATLTSAFVIQMRILQFCTRRFVTHLGACNLCGRMDGRFTRNIDFIQEKVVISYDKNRRKAYPTYPGRS